MVRTKKYFYKSDNFSKHLMFTTLNKRGKWEPVSDSKDSDLCIISGNNRTCSDFKSCKKNFYDLNCKNSLVRGDFEMGIFDYLFNRNHYKLQDKKSLYQSIKQTYGERDYIPLTYNINLNNIDRYKELFNNNDIFYLKPNEGFERRGQLKTSKFRDVKKQLLRYKHYKDWQLQEFIESYTKNDSFIRSVCILVLKDDKLSLYNSQINEFAGIKHKQKNTVHHRIGQRIRTNDLECHSFKLNENDYIGKSGIANDEYNKLLGKRYYEKKLLPKINTIIKEAVLSIGDISNSSDKLSFHIFGVDLMIDKQLNVKLLEFNIYPTHFINSFRECIPLKIAEKMVGGKKIYDKKLKYETQLLDEIMSVTIDKIYRTNRKVKLNILKKLI